MHSTESSQDISHQVHHRETTPVNPQNPTFDSPPMTTPPKMEGLLSQSRPESPRIKSLKEVTTNMPKMTQATSTGAVSQRGSIVISSNDPPTADSPDLARSKSHHKSRFHVHVPHVHMPHFFKHHSHKSDTNKSEYWPRTLSVAVGAPKAQPTGISPSVSSKLRQEIKAPDHDTLQPPIVAEASSSYFPPAASSTGVATTSSTSSIHSSPVSIPIPKPVPDLDGVGEILPRDTSLVPSAKESIRTAASSGSSNASTVDTDGTGIGSTSTSVTSYDSASSSPMNQKPHHDHAGPPSTFQAAMGRGLNANEVVPSSSLNPLPSDTTDPLVEVSLPEASSLPDINETEVALPEPQSFFPGSASKEIPPGEDPLKKWSFSFISSNKSKLDLKTKRSPKSGTANTSHTSTPSPRSLIIPLTAVAKTAKSTDEKSSPTLETTPTAKLKGHDATKPSSMRGRVRDMNVHGPTLWYRMSQPHTDQDVAEFLLGVDLKEENARRKQENAEKHKSWAQKNRIEKEEGESQLFWLEARILTHRLNSEKRKVDGENPEERGEGSERRDASYSR
ncbi:hypothetical protein CC2G_007500 [Coprinopsis cinerea AmutBmut pab1-1]|nr:hypothetical protein CC2G_007500 [Coprinopsis cinerea AmutBmut pab1-1]